jgi:hypothetical protein
MDPEAKQILRVIAMALAALAQEAFLQSTLGGITGNAFADVREEKLMLSAAIGSLRDAVMALHKMEKS